MRKFKTLFFVSLVLILVGCEKTISINLVEKQHNSDLFIKEAKERKRCTYLFAVGNSWTINSTAYLGGILESKGIETEIHLSYYPGAPLELYYNNIKSGEKILEYHHWTKDKGWVRNQGHCSLNNLLKARVYDIITLQQQSSKAGLYETIAPYLPSIISYYKQTSVNVIPILYYNVTWSYPDYATLSSFSNYKTSSDVMYKSILKTWENIKRDNDIDFHFRTADVIQKARKLGLSDIDTPDGSHLSKTGEYIASLLWAKTLMVTFYEMEGGDVFFSKESTYCPEGISDNDLDIIFNMINDYDIQT